MVSNKQIKAKEIWKLKNKLICKYGELKKAQNDLIVAINNCALCELEKANVLKVGVTNQNMKIQVKRYTHLYMEIKCLENDIKLLESWKVNESTTNNND